jgi:hypothetical protein
MMTITYYNNTTLRGALVLFDAARRIFNHRLVVPMDQLFALATTDDPEAALSAYADALKGIELEDWELDYGGPVLPLINRLTGDGCTLLQHTTCTGNTTLSVTKHSYGYRFEIRRTHAPLDPSSSRDQALACLTHDLLQGGPSDRGLGVYITLLKAGIDETIIDTFGLNFGLDIEVGEVWRYIEDNRLTAFAEYGDWQLIDLWCSRTGGDRDEEMRAAMALRDQLETS